MSEKQYWKGIEELNATPEYTEAASNEFKEDLPFDLNGKLLDATTPRRDFLKYLGFSTLAATIAASCEMPVRNVIPYAIKPDTITPGVAQYYASTFSDGGDYCAVVIKTRDGRPIKLEGNKKSSITQGATSARVQASVLSLYDKARLRHPFIDGKENTFEAVDKMVMSGLNGQVVLLTSSILSPTSKKVIAQFLAKYPNSKHVTYDAISYSGLLEANGGCPSYRFDKAKTIFSLGADFLGTWLSYTEYARQYSKGRKVSATNPHMSKHYQVEAVHSVSGAAADERATCKPSEFAAVAQALLNAVQSGATPNFASKKLNALISKAAKDLLKGNGLVVCGSNDANTQATVARINAAIKANGTTIENIKSNYRQGKDSDMVALVNDMKNGQVGALLMYDVNPVYDYFDAKAFTEALSKVNMTVSFAERMDETAQKSKVIAPTHHYLERWGDAEPKTGFYSLQQPGIAPLFKTRAMEDSLLIWAGSSETYGDIWNEFWVGKLGSQKALDQALQDGVIEPATAEAEHSTVAEPASDNAATENGTSNIAAAAAASIPSATPKSTGEMEIVVYEKASIGRGGNWSNNPWLQEMPDPLTKATWDNYACVSPWRAKQLDAELNGINEVELAKRVVKISVKGREPLLLPVVVVPGMHNDVVAVAVGFGRDKNVGMAAANTGQNAFPFVSFNGKNFLNHQTAKVESTKDFYEVAITQAHHSYEGRPIIHEYTLSDFAKNPHHLLDSRKEELGHYAALPWVSHDEHGGGEHGESASHGVREKSDETMSRAGAESQEFEDNFRENGTLYPNYKHEGIHWGMSIDLTSCIGCGACVIGCQAENNISVVGKERVGKAQEMHWIRIDRYFSGSPDDPDSIQTVFQPMMCQHCDNAPCENVCPVNATNHSSEGLNQMAYNRCIGTKYCANNCPYKVRHFNWMDWNGADSFEDNLYTDGRRDDMNDDLTRMVLNPDVTVRARGVMEKCSFCVQRLQDAKLQAKKEGHPMEDGQATTACQTACPTDCIVFGDMNDKNSEIYKVRRKDNAERVYHVLEQLHTLPNVSYLSKIRNTDIIVAGDEKLDIIAAQHI